MKHSLKVENGKFTGVGLAKFIATIKALEGSYVNVTLEKQKDRRSAEQNKYYWGCLVLPFYQFLKGIGEVEIADKEEAHELLKLKCNGKTVTIDGKQERYAKSTAELSVDEFSEYIERCEVYLASIGVELPDLM